MNFRVFRHSFYKKMFLYIAILVLVIILTSSFVFYFNFENIGLKMQYNATMNILSEISYSATYLNDTAKNTAAYIYSNNDYSTLRYGRYTSTEDAYKSITGLEALVSQSSNVHSIFIYNKDIDTFYSTWWRFFSPAEDFIDTGIVDIIKNNKIPNKQIFTSTPILRKIPLNYTNNNDAYISVITYIMTDYSLDGKVLSAIIINLSSQYLDGLINILNTKGSLTGGDTIIINSSGYAVAGSNSSSGFNDMSDKVYIKKILNNNDKNGYFIDNIDGRKVVVTYVASDVLDWKFVNITPYDQIFKDINIMKRNIYIVCVTIVVLGFLLSYFLAKYLYHPINSMIGKVQQLSNVRMEKNKKNELDFLTDIFTETFEKAKNMQSVNYENYIIKRSSFLRDLIVNEAINIDEVHKMFIKYKIALNSESRFVLCNFSIDHYSYFSQNLSIEDQKLFRFAICNVAGELMLKHLKNECFELDDKNIMLLIEMTDAEQDSYKDNLRETVGEIQDWCLSNLNISLSAALGMEPVNLMDISESYKFIMQLSRYRLVYGHKSLLMPEAVFRLKTNAFEHPIALEQKLDESLNNGKLCDSIETYNRIIDYITDYSYETINSYILYLSYLIIKKANDLEAKGYEKIVFDSNSYISEIISLETLPEINDRVVNLFKAIIDTIEHKRFKRKNGIAERVKTIIESEYMDKSLCQDAVANRLNISRDYLGKMFRETYSKSFADYLTEIRLQKAVQYMGNSKMSITEILDEIGWENKNYFYTTFKLKYGITTSQYRNISLNK
ncbi:MAG: AraC family transcriptional regulator [Eubacterium sp.]|nr:AraC family transcriptional regulator [Eubacterium sp.]